MKKIIALSLFVLLTLSCASAFASLHDTRATIAAQYGEYRFVIDNDNQLWTKADWDAKGSKRAVANSYIYYFSRNGLNFQMEVQYDGTKPESFVRAQRITPDMGIKIKELKDYLPEIYELATAPEAGVFTTTNEITRNFREKGSPVTLGVMVKKQIKRSSTYYTMLAFSIKDEGRLVNEAKFITPDTYIEELVLERRLIQEGSESQWAWQKTNMFK